MKSEYKRDMNHNYLILYEDMELDTSSYQVRMLVGNVIPVLLKCQFHGVDGKIVFHYDITSKQSIAVLYESKLLKEADLRLIFGSFVQVMEQMAEYLLNPGQVLLQPEYMYMDVNKNEIYFCYLPGKEREVKEQFQSLTEYILPKIDHGDERAVVLGYGVYRCALEDNFHLEHVKEELFRDYNKREENTGRENKCTNPGWDSEILDSTTEKKKESIEYAEDKLEALFEYESDEMVKGNRHASKRRELDLEKDSKKKNQISQKIYILVPVTGTVIIMAILAANMVGILPWIEVEILLITVVLVSMLISFLCFLSGKIQNKKHKEENDRQWKEKVRRYKERETKIFEHDEEFDRNKNQRNESAKYENTSVENKDWIIESRKNEIEASGYKPDKKESQNDFGETVVLSAASIRRSATLVSKEPGELAAIYLKDDLTVIGKLETAVDAVIPFPTISRLHAKVRKKDGEYYLADLNSRNGTSVNGRMLKMNEEYLLQDEDEVDFAEARYIFLK